MSEDTSEEYRRVEYTVKWTERGDRSGKEIPRETKKEGVKDIWGSSDC